jgi:hypothetical protein
MLGVTPMMLGLISMMLRVTPMMLGLISMMCIA